ncbi:MAG: response regulator [Marinicellaceae bacterium]
MQEKINILVVDDNQINRQYFTMALKKLGCEVTAVESGKKAVEAASKIDFSLVFMDIRMPEMDGYEASKRIKEFKNHYSTPILAISAETLVEETHNNFDGFILKPASPALLKENLEKFCILDNNIKIFDQEQALNYAYGDDEIMHKLIKMFINELPIQMNLLEQSIKISNSVESRNIIHKIRGSCQTCGAMALESNLKTLSSQLNNQTNANNAFTETQKSVGKFISQFD